MNQDPFRARRLSFWALVIVSAAIAGIAIVWLITHAPGTLIERYYSCKDCRAVRCVTEQSRFGVRLSESETLDARTPIPAGHEHQWWKYHTHTISGGVESWACAGSRYEDGRDD